MHPPPCAAEERGEVSDRCRLAAREGHEVALGRWGSPTRFWAPDTSNVTSKNTAPTKTPISSARSLRAASGAAQQQQMRGPKAKQRLGQGSLGIEKTSESAGVQLGKGRRGPPEGARTSAAGAGWGCAVYPPACARTRLPAHG
jgi:hypothetical protein